MATSNLIHLGRQLACAALIWAMTFGGLANAITITVPGDYDTIQGAINAAQDGDEIVVSPGVYVENVNVGGKNVVLRSTATDPVTVASTIIDGHQAGPVVTFAGSETSDCVLSGFTIRNGQAFAGSGIWGNANHARIEYNTIMGNSAYYGGGLALCHGTILSNTITGNWAHSHGGGLHGCGGTIQNNTITGNSAYYGGGLHGCGATILNNTITANSAYYGGGLDHCGPTIQNNTIAANSANWGGGASDCPALIVNCIVWGNSATDFPQIYNCRDAIYSCIESHTGGGEGNIAQDPLFVGPDNYHLQADSPCIDAGSNDHCPATDKDGNQRPFDGNNDGQAVCDMGAYEYVGADLVVTTGSVTPAQARQGRLVQISLQVQNAGANVAGTHWTHVYLSTDEFYSADDFCWIMGIFAEPLDPGETFGYTAMAVVPALAPGLYHVLVQCDVLDEVPESNEENNVLDIGTLALPTRAGRWSLYR